MRQIKNSKTGLLSFSEGDCTKYQESAALPELAACKAA
jgi:hypothetical protein